MANQMIPAPPVAGSRSARVAFSFATLRFRIGTVAGSLPAGMVNAMGSACRT